MMESPLFPDHETDLRRRFDEQRRLFVQLARDPGTTLNSELMLAQIRHTEALQRLRDRWQSDASSES